MILHTTCVRCGNVTEDTTRDACLNCQLTLAEIARNTRPATSVPYQDQVAFRLLEEALDPS